MKNYDEQIVRYLDYQLSEEEKIEFEKKLRFDEELGKAYLEFLQVHQLISASKNTEASEDYFNSIIPRFRKSLKKEIKASPFKKVSYGFVTFIMIICSFYIFDNLNTNLTPVVNSIDSITENISGEQINDVRNYLTDNSWVSTSEDIVYQVVDEDDFSLEEIIQDIQAAEGVNILDDYQINNIESFAGEDELQQAYDELLSKSIL